MIDGYIKRKNETYLITSLNKIVKNSSSDKVLIYKSSDVIANSGKCGVSDSQEQQFLKMSEGNSSITGISALRNIPTTCRFLEIATEADFEYFQAFGSSIQAANNEIINILNQVEGAYQTSFNIRFVLVFQSVWTTSNDPYTFAGDGNGLISELKSFWSVNRANVKRDIVHLFSGKNHGTLLGSVGSNGLGVVCKELNNSYGFTANRFGAFQTTAHEIGHNFGGTHPTDVESGCGTSNNSIMCQGLDKVMRFSNFSENQINTHINSNGACLLLLENFGISGGYTSAVCSNGIEATYTLNHRFSSVNTAWTVGSNLTIVSSTNNSVTVRSANIPNSGIPPGISTYVSASINMGGSCGSIVEAKSVYLGTPVITNQKVDGQSYYINYPICLGNHWLDVTPMGGTTTNATWTVPQGIPFVVGTNTLDFTLPFNSSAISISVRSSNACGPGNNYFFWLSKKTFGCPSSFTISAFPNPAQSELSVSVNPSNELSQTEILIESAQIMYSNGNVVSESVKSGGILKFNLRGLSKGTYYLRLTIEGNKFQERILID